MGFQLYNNPDAVSLFSDNSMSTSATITFGWRLFYLSVVMVKMGEEVSSTVS